MKPTFSRAGLVAACASLAACGLFGPKETATDAGATRTTASEASAVPHGLSFVGGEPFEGEITMTVQRQGSPPTVVFYDVKGAKMRVSATPRLGDTSYTIVDSAAGQVVSVSDAKHKVTRTNAGAKGPADSKSHAVAVSAHQVDVVAGYLCDVYRVDADGGEGGEACMASGLHFTVLDPAGAPWLADLGANGFPLRVVVTDASGRVESRMEVTKVEPSTFPDPLFSVPPGYASVDLVEAGAKGADAH